MTPGPNHRLHALLDDLQCGSDGIWSAKMPISEQETEKNLREKVATGHQGDYLKHIALHHSISVMDSEVARFLDRLPPDSSVLDVGGCWGWHWRNLRDRPEVLVVIVDFVRANLIHAKNLLGPLVGNQVALVHADALQLPFKNKLFDGIWTVQTFQHIIDFRQACREAYRVLKFEGRFINYSLQTTPCVEFIYRLVGKSYHKRGNYRNLFHLTRASDEQRNILEQVFYSPIIDRYTECLFHPDLRLTFSGKPGSWTGLIDVRLSKIPSIACKFARQRSFEVVKGIKISES